MQMIQSNYNNNKHNNSEDIQGKEKEKEKEDENQITLNFINTLRVSLPVNSNVFF
jgi:hypothetical protein